jgi:hypothetical protein
VRYTPIVANDHGVAEVRYVLSDHVFACRLEDHVVLLDLLQDKYLAVTGVEARQLSSVIDGWPADAACAPGASAPQGDASCDELVRRLASKGIVTSAQSSSRKSAQPTNYRPPLSGVTDEADFASPPIGLGHGLRFFTAAVTISVILKTRSLQAVVARVRRRKLAHRPEQRTVAAEQVKSLVTIYERLRPLLFTARDASLFDSLVLVEFLAKYGIFPELILGVKPAPFAAHAWVQADGLVLGDRSEYAAKFTPIVIV